MAEVKLERESLSWEPHFKEEPASPHIEKEAEVFPFHIITVKNEEEQDKASVLHQREKTEKDTGNYSPSNTEDSSESDHSEDFGEEQSPKAKRSYTELPPESCVTDHRPFSCLECGKMFSRNDHLKRHMVTHSGERAFKCPVCEKSFAVKDRLSRHLEVVHEKKQHARPFSCSECGAKFRFNSDLQKHVSSIHRRETPYKCSICEKSFSLKRYLGEHIKTHTREKSFHCEFCKKGFTQKSKLKLHMKIHTGEKPFVCSFCEEAFDKKSTLSFHRSQVHNVETVKPFSCSQCGKNFGTNSELQRHASSVHRGEKPHKCSVCEKRFTQKGSLNIHMKSHTEEKPFVCRVCGAGFKQSNRLKNHMWTHPAQRPDKQEATPLEEQKRYCPICKSSLNGKSLPFHMKLVHFICTVCDKQLPDKIEVEAHHKTHEEDMKPFSCSDCGKRFKFEAHLLNHLDTHSGAKPRVSSKQVFMVP